MSKIVDVLNADRERHRNHRYGRDYYTKQASIPSGRKKNVEEDSNWSFIDGNQYTTTPTFHETSEFDPNLISGYEYDREYLQNQHSSNDEDNFKIAINNEDPNENENYFHNTENLPHVSEEKELKVRVNTEGLLYHAKDDNEKERSVAKLVPRSFVPRNEPKVAPISNKVDQNLKITVNTEGLVYIPEGTDENSENTVTNLSRNDERKFAPKINKTSYSAEENEETTVTTSPKTAPKVNKLNQFSQKNHQQNLKITVNTEGLLYMPEGAGGNSEITVTNLDRNEPKSFSVEQNVKATYTNLDRNKPRKFAPEMIKSSFSIEGNEEIALTRPKFAPRIASPQFSVDGNVETTVTTPKFAPKINKTSFSVEENEETRVASPNKSTPKVSSPQFSIEENVENRPVIINKKSDNTLIKKIYSDPVVRSFALTNREQIPVKLDDSFKAPAITKPMSGQDEPKEIKISSITGDALLLIDDGEEEEKISEDFDGKDKDYGNISDSEPYRRQHSLYKEQHDLHELKEKRLVANRLGEFSKSFPNLSKLSCINENSNFHSYKSHEKQHYEDEIQSDIFVSVKNLKKLFENN